MNESSIQQSGEKHPMRTMSPADILRHENYAVMRFFDENDSYVLNTFDREDKACLFRDQMNDAMRPMYGEDQYEVVAIDHEASD